MKKHMTTTTAEESTITPLLTPSYPALSVRYYDFARPWERQVGTDLAEATVAASLGLLPTLWHDSEGCYIMYVNESRHGAGESVGAICVYRSRNAFAGGSEEDDSEQTPKMSTQHLFFTCLHIKPAFQNKGLESKLLERVLELEQSRAVGENTFARLRCILFAEHDAAEPHLVQFYEQHGFCLMDSSSQASSSEDDDNDPHTYHPPRYMSKHISLVREEPVLVVV